MKTVELTDQIISQINNLGLITRRIRESHELSQVEVAEALSVTPGYISNVENGRTAMSIKVLLYYAVLEGISLDVLVGIKDPETKEPDTMDEEIMSTIKDLTVEQKQKILEHIKVQFGPVNTEESFADLDNQDETSEDEDAF